MSPTLVKFIDFVLFQACWFACVWGGRDDDGMRALIATLAFVAIHLFCLTARERRLVEALSISICGLIGVALEAVGVLLGTLCFHDGVARSWGLPLFMWCLWFSFPPLLDSSLRWLRGRTAIAALLGAVGGPLAYLAGERLGALGIGKDRVGALCGIGALWALYTPLCVSLRARWARTRSLPMKSE